MDPKERINFQKKQLKQRLGLGADFMDLEFFSENDLHSRSQSSLALNIEKKEASKILEEATMTKIKAQMPDSNINMEGLSARERNKLKRQAKMAAKGRGSIDQRYCIGYFSCPFLIPLALIPT